MRTTIKRFLSVLNGLLLVAIFLLFYQLYSERAKGIEPGRGGGGQTFLRGDSNDDGGFDISDAVSVLLFLFDGGIELPCPAAADVDDNATLEITDAVYSLNHLFVDGPPPAAPYPEPGVDPTPDLDCRGPVLPPLPPVGSLGGPDRELTAEESLSWRRGREIFDRRRTVAGGLGPRFNGDSCRGCHLDPVVGGAGGLDLDVVRYAMVDDANQIHQLPGGPAASRHSIPGVTREEIEAEANVIETRQPPTLLGLGLVDRLPDAVILAGEDPDDLDGDGISGRALRIGGRIGRFGHKASIPSLKDFAADAMINELGVTVDPLRSDFAGAADEDLVPDPELAAQDFTDIVFFMQHLAAPLRHIPDDPLSQQRVEDGEQIFLDLGCASCHSPALEGDDGPVRAYSDVLLHDVANPARWNVDEPGIEPREFRTAPLWGLTDTAPYLHDGSAETVRAAILSGHYGEAKGARDAFDALSFNQKLKVEEFLKSL